MRSGMKKGLSLLLVLLMTLALLPAAFAETEEQEIESTPEAVTEQADEPAEPEQLPEQPEEEPDEKPEAPLEEPAEEPAEEPEELEAEPEAEPEEVRTLEEDEPDPIDVPEPAEPKEDVRYTTTPTDWTATPIIIGSVTTTVATNGYKLYEFVPTETGRYRFYSDYGSYLDTYCVMFDANHTEITRDDDSAGNGQFSITRQLQADEHYFFCVSLYSDFYSATFTVVLEQFPVGWSKVNGEWYYYPEDGSTLDGIWNINGTLYWFETNRMCTDLAVEWQGVPYLVESNGVAQAVTTDGWKHTKNDPDTKYLVKDGHFVVGYYHDETEDQYYYFLDDYSMLRGRMIDDYNEETGESTCYRTKKDGTLYVNSWYQDLDGDWFYYGEKGVGARGYTTIGGKQYRFDDDARMFVNTLFHENDGYYYAGSDGVIRKFKEGWNKVGEIYYYLKNGELLRSCIEKIGNFWYAFDYDGWMIDNRTYEIDEHEYRARAGGQLYCGCWFDAGYDCWYYYDSNCEMVTGLMELNGKLYLFNTWGELIMNRPVYVEAELFFADGDGVLQDSHDGWTCVGNNWYYVQNGEYLESCVSQIAGKYYGFDDNGRMYDNDWFYCDGYYYCAKPGGVLYRNEWYSNEYEDKDGFATETYYYGDDGAAVTGLQTINGKQYDFWGDGLMKTNTVVTHDGVLYVCGSDGVMLAVHEGWNAVGDTYCYIQNGTLLKATVTTIDGTLYAFDNEGLMKKNDWGVYNGRYYRAQKSGALYAGKWFREIGGSWYYYGTDGFAPDGLTTIGGVQYFFRYGGQMATNCVLNIDGELYLAGNGGGLTKAKNNAWNKIGTTYYYIEDGALLQNCVRQINGAYYAFDAMGRMYADCAFYRGGYNYRARANGSLYVNSWYEGPLKTWYYFGAYGIAADGLMTVGSAQYYFLWNGQMATSGIYSSGRNTYLVAENGEAVRAKDGWNTVGGATYYIDGTVYVTGRCYIDGSCYYFDQNGVLLHSTATDGYVINTTGRIVQSGWYQLDGTWFYVKNGRYVTGSQQIGSKWYFFTDSGHMMTGEVFRDGKKFVYGTDGAKISETKLKNGWTLCDGNYYYYRNGKRYTGWAANYYIQKGVMIRNSIVEGKYLGEDGRIMKNAWIGRYYAKSDGFLARNQWLQLDGSWYYFFGYQATVGVRIISGKIYQFNDSGKLIATLAQSVNNGWVKAGSDYAYVYQGELVREELAVIDGTTYAFDSRALMVRYNFNVDYYGNNEIYYFGGNGAKVAYTGWKQINGNWYFFNADNTLKIGTFLLNGKTYVCTPDMRTGWRTTGSDLTHFGSSGAADTILRNLDGWVTKDGVSYYYRDGRRCEYGIELIDGKMYGFNGDGTLAKNTAIPGFFYRKPTSDYDLWWYYDSTERVGAYYFCGADGTVARTKGWKTGADGSKYYTDANGRCSIGIRIIDGKTYIFSNTGKLVG